MASRRLLRPPVWADLPEKALNACAAYVCMPALIIVVVLDISLRAFSAGSAIFGISEVAETLLLAIFLFATPSAFQPGRAVRMDFLYRRLRGRLLLAANLVGLLCAVIFVLALTIDACFALIDHVAFVHQTPTLRIPYWLFDGMIIVCGLASFWRLLRNAAHLLLTGQGGHAPSAT